MAKRPKTQARRSARKSMPTWAWLFIGLSLGAIGFGYLHFRDRWQHPFDTLPKPNPEAQAPANGDDDGAVVDPAEKPKPTYDFYKLLPEKEVEIPDDELNAQAKAEAAKAEVAKPVPAPNTTDQITPPDKATSSTLDNKRYLIQAGAFRGNNEAEALKAQIALTGEVARVESAQINGITVYRVRMGPYPNASTLSAAKQALASHGIAVQAIRVK